MSYAPGWTSLYIRGINPVTIICIIDMPSILARENSRKPQQPVQHWKNNWSRNMTSPTAWLRHRNSDCDGVELGSWRASSPRWTTCTRGYTATCTGEPRRDGRGGAEGRGRTEGCCRRRSLLIGRTTPCGPMLIDARAWATTWCHWRPSHRILEPGRSPRS